MFLPRDKNDRVMFITLATLASVSGYVWFDSSASSALPAGAVHSSAVPQPTPAQLASVPLAPNGPAPLAHTITKIAKTGGAASIVRDPSDLPPPIGKRGPMRVRVELETVEVTGKLADGATYRYWTFNRKVPGPFIRVRVGDTVEVHLKNDGDSMMMHNVDFHAVTGFSGGAQATETAPGATSAFEFKPLYPGIYVYHCGTAPVAQHIASGMYGMILVEPEGGLPKVDREFYVMQGEIYTEAKFGAKGEQTESYEKLIDERPEYFVFNGAVGGLTKEKPLHAKVGETVRIFFGDAGPNFTSSFHMMGAVLDRVYPFGSLTSAPLTDVQTISVPPGGATMAELKLAEPGKYMFVDHTLSRLERGLVGALQVDGPVNPNIYKAYPPAGADAHKQAAHVM